MELALLLYLASVSENIKTLLDSLTLVGLIGTLICTAWTGIYSFTKYAGSCTLYSDEEFTEFKNQVSIGYRGIFISATLFCLVSAVNALVPTKNNAYVMGGGYVALSAMRSESASVLKDKSLLAIESWLDQELSKNLTKAKENLSAKAKGAIGPKSDPAPTEDEKQVQQFKQILIGPDGKKYIEVK